MRRSLPFLIAVSLVVTACGGGDDDAADEPAAADETSDDASVDDGADDADIADDAMDDEPAGDDDTDDLGGPIGDGGGEHPVVRFTAHGPAAPNTFGPSCAMGIETTSLNSTRVTAPESWTYRGSGGGTGSSDIRFEVEGGSVLIDVATADYDRTLIGEIVAGAEVATVDIDGTSVPIVEVTVDDRPGYAIDQLVWMEPLPEMFGGSMAMTVTMTADPPEVLSLEDATSVLGTVRVERCSAVSEALVAMAAIPVLAVPEFDPDPLGKTYPGGDQPAFDMQNVINAYSTEQLAYLLPLEEPVATCVAESLQTEVPEAFILQMGVLSPVEGDQQDALMAIADTC